MIKINLLDSVSKRIARQKFTKPQELTFFEEIFLYVVASVFGCLTAYQLIK